MNTLTKQLAKRGAGIAVGFQLVALGKQLDKARENKMENEQVAEEVTEYDYEFVFYEKAVVSMKDTLSSMMQIIIGNGIDIDNSLFNEASKLIEMLEWVIEKKVNDGNQA